ncbi:MAG TPA: GMC family oxidoreductase [Bryobacteraceae bacterium]|nr:GMC family oxidoreductase [Bryobacteraceae bacterium]
MALKRVNAVIVGAGAGGGIVAKELAEAGLSVVLLERGKWYTAFDCRKDDLRNQRTSPLGQAFGPDDERFPRVAVDAQGHPQIVRASGPGYHNNAACVGGGTFSYGAMAWRYLEKDFRMRSTYGRVAGSTLEDWPISYPDLEPYYEKAEWEIGVSGDWSGDPFHAPRRKPLPMPPLPPNREYQILYPAAKRLGLHPFDIPMLRNSVPYNGRPACIRCRWCVGFACEVDAKCGTHNTVIPKAMATKNCELRTECVVKEILTNDRGRVTGVTYFDANDQLQQQDADVVIVSCAAIESARLLLNSKSRLFPNGLGNRYDWVGRNLQGHTYTGALGVMPFDIYDDLGPGAGIAVSDYNHGNPGLAGGAMLANEFIRLPIQFASMIPPGMPRWGKAHKDFMRSAFRRAIAIQGPTQEMPMFNARVQVDPVVKDHWGIPVARLSGDKHPHTVEIGTVMAGKAEAWLKEAGAVQTWKKLPGAGLSAGQHQAGTCRMGDDPKTSVVNRYCQVHDVDNLFVIDGSVHVTNGGFNPVLTIMAMAYYASDRLVKQWKGSRFA